MTGMFLCLVGILYLMTAISYVIDGNIGMGIAFSCYSLANIGLYMAGKV